MFWQIFVIVVWCLCAVLAYGVLMGYQSEFRSSIRHEWPYPVSGVLALFSFLFAPVLGLLIFQAVLIKGRRFRLKYREDEE